MGLNFKIGTDKDANANFNKGLITRLPVQELPEGAAADSLNWLTKDGKIELNRGYTALGTEQAGLGRASGIKVGRLLSGTEVIFYSYLTKVKYFSTVTSDWVEVLGLNAYESVATGDGSKTVFGPYTLAQKARTSQSTFSGLSIYIDGTLFMSDVGDGTISGTGGSGTIDYTTGILNLTFNTSVPNLGKITVTYSYSDILGGLVQDRDTSFATFESLAGNQMWINSPHSGPQKIMIANPGLATNMYDASKNYKAHMTIKQNRAYNWQIGGTDNNRVRLSYEEVRGLEDFTPVSNELMGVGDNSTKTFGPHIMVTKITVPRATFMAVSVTDGVESFVDNLDGTLTGSLGGTGTVNYTTGAVSVTFNTAPGTNVNVSYEYVDEAAAGSAGAGGIANFVVPDSRVSGDPNVFPQLTGGVIQTILSLKENRFCGHKNAIYNIMLTQDDADATNLIFRENFGISSLRGGAESEEGIYTVNINDPAGPRFVVVGFNTNSIEITPKIISFNLDLSGYSFDDLCVSVFNDLVLYECASSGSNTNDTTFVYNRIYKWWDKLDYAYSCADVYNGAFTVGDTVSNNIFTLFSGIDADGANIFNFWKSGIMKLREKALKKIKKIKLEGEVGPNQSVQFFASLDRGPFVELKDSNGGAFIQGNGDYVDRTQSVDVGAATLGTHPVGGGTNGIEAYHYERMLSFGQDRFSEVQFMVMAPGIGYASVTLTEFHDIRIFQDKTARKYRV